MVRASPIRLAVPAVAGIVGTLLVSSCSARVALHPVRGKVLVAGKPAVGAIVVLHPLEPPALGLRPPSGRVEADGSFTLSTLVAGDGAPAGEYRVAIAWLGDVSKADPVTGEVPVKLAPRYADPKTSDLRAHIKEGPNELPPFQLTK